MYKRIVLLKSPDAPAVSTLLQELHGFPGRVPGLVAVEVIADSGDRSLGYDQGFILTFTDESMLPSWREHPLHAGFRPRLRALCQMLIFDYPLANSLPQEEDRHAYA